MIARLPKYQRGVPGCRNVAISHIIPTATSTLVRPYIANATTHEASTHPQHPQLKSGVNDIPTFVPAMSYLFSMQFASHPGH